MTFRSLHIIEPILTALEEEGYDTPTPIQAQAIPVLMQGKDVLGIAQTGTGKTAAFSIPIIQAIASDRHPAKRRATKALIVTPTRELAIQIDESIRTYGKHCNIRTAVIFGGVSQQKQVGTLHRGVDIIVATPGRLLDLYDQKLLSLDRVETFVLDEADRMLDMGFVHDVKRIIEIIPQKRQSLLFSATMPAAIVKLSGSILTEPTKIEVTPGTPTVERIAQELYFVEQTNKVNLLIHLLDQKNIGSALVFTRTKRRADLVAKVLNRSDITAEAIHGDKAQNARQRALTKFKNGEVHVLVATDIAARGIDIDDLKFVVNYNVPNEPETYVHRIGRTGRAGAEGTAITFCDSDEKVYVRDIQALIGKRIPVISEHPFSPKHRHDTEEPKLVHKQEHRTRSSEDIVAKRMNDRPSGHSHKQTNSDKKRSRPRRGNRNNRRKR